MVHATRVGKTPRPAARARTRGELRGEYRVKSRGGGRNNGRGKTARRVGERKVNPRSSRHVSHRGFVERRRNVGKLLGHIAGRQVRHSRKGGNRAAEERQTERKGKQKQRHFFVRLGAHAGCAHRAKGVRTKSGGHSSLQGLRNQR